MKSITLQSLLDQGQVWTANGASLKPALQGARSTGFEALDAQLSQGGWPAYGITEIHSSHPGQGELQLILPSLQRSPKLWVWLDPPHNPMPQALIRHGITLSQCLLIRTHSPGDALWASERCLQSGCVDTLMSWLRQPPNPSALKRLQMAAERGQALAHLVHHQSNWQLDAGTHARITLHPSDEHGSVTVNLERQRGGRRHAPLQLPLLAMQSERTPVVPSRSAQLSWLDAAS